MNIPPLAGPQMDTLEERIKKELVLLGLYEPPDVSSLRVCAVCVCSVCVQCVCSVCSMCVCAVCVCVCILYYVYSQ